MYSQMIEEVDGSTSNPSTSTNSDPQLISNLKHKSDFSFKKVYLSPSNRSEHQIYQLDNNMEFRNLNCCQSFGKMRNPHVFLTTTKTKRISPSSGGSAHNSDEDSTLNGSSMNSSSINPNEINTVSCNCSGN